MKTIIIDGIEYNLTPKVLFKKGDFVVIQETTYQITKVENLNVTLSLNGRECLFDIDVLKNARLWDITKDAKDGDVLCTYEYGEPKIVFILKGTPKKCYALGYYCYYNIIYPHFEADSEKGCLAPNDEDFKPATKEQSDLLFAKMKEASYEWDAEKKKLKGIEPDEWSEECCINQLIVFCENCMVQDTNAKRCANFLKSLKDRYTWKPTEEQMVFLKKCIEAYNEVTFPTEVRVLSSLYNDLKKL